MKIKSCILTTPSVAGALPVPAYTGVDGSYLEVVVNLYDTANS